MQGDVDEEFNEVEEGEEYSSTEYEQTESDFFSYPTFILFDLSTEDSAMI